MAQERHQHLNEIGRVANNIGMLEQRNLKAELVIQVYANVNDVQKKNETYEKLFWNTKKWKKTFFNKIKSTELENPRDQLHDYKQTNQLEARKGTFINQFNGFFFTLTKILLDENEIGLKVAQKGGKKAEKL